MRILAPEPPGAEKPPTLPPAAKTLWQPFSRFEQLVHRFHDWKQSNGRDDLARSSGAQRSRGLHQLGVMHPDLARPAGRATGLDQKAIALLLLDSMHRGCRVPR